MEVLCSYGEEELKKKLKRKLDEKRYAHSVGVAYTAVSLVMRHGNIDKLEDGGAKLIAQAYTAGLLHDCAKCLEDDERDKLCRNLKIEVSDFEKEYPYLIHAKLGAALAEKKYGVTDAEILSAIRYHTTGHSDMTLLEGIIFSADFIEPTRKPLIIMPMARQALFEDLDYGIYVILEQTLKHLKNKGQPVEEHTLEAYEWYKRYKREV
ncbi:MAG: bis(5'-nucleosyl)-tetraphosphatase (symmetrical) YqeK [Lachnospiraceae bacterium]|nr:bis(5'-nucleosyl)-tetraphosphatase (symmetrical) YqeK [Lachnospiraceae bacterium]